MLGKVGYGVLDPPLQGANAEARMLSSSAPTLRLQPVNPLTSGGSPTLNLRGDLSCPLLAVVVLIHPGFRIETREPGCLFGHDATDPRNEGLYLDVSEMRQDLMRRPPARFELATQTSGGNTRDKAL